jgi:hypothetical protein
MYNGVYRRITRANPDKLEAIIEAFTSSSSAYYITRHQSIKNYGSLTIRVRTKQMLARSSSIFLLTYNLQS